MGFKVTDQDCSLDYGGISKGDGSLLEVFFPIIEILTSIGKAVGLPMGDTM